MAKKVKDVLDQVEEKVSEVVAETTEEVKVEVTEEVKTEVTETEDEAKEEVKTEEGVESVIVNEITCPHCNGKIIIEVPAPQRRGQLAGLDILEMSDEQLKREIINAKSVLYKAKKRGAGADTIAKNQARVDAVMAEKAKRDALKVPAQPATEAAVEGVITTPVAEEVSTPATEELAAEI